MQALKMARFGFCPFFYFRLRPLTLTGSTAQVSTKFGTRTYLPRIPIKICVGDGHVLYIIRDIAISRVEHGLSLRSTARQHYEGTAKWQKGKAYIRCVVGYALASENNTMHNATGSSYKSYWNLN